MKVDGQAHNAEQESDKGAFGGECAETSVMNFSSPYLPDGVVRVKWIESSDAMMLIFTPSASRTLFWAVDVLRFEDLRFLVDQLIPGIAGVDNVVTLAKEHNDTRYPLTISLSRYGLWAIQAFIGELEAFMLMNEHKDLTSVAITSSPAYYWWSVVNVTICVSNWVCEVPIHRHIGMTTAQLVRDAVKFRDSEMASVVLPESELSKFSELTHNPFSREGLKVKMPISCQYDFSDINLIASLNLNEGLFIESQIASMIQIIENNEGCMLLVTSSKEHGKYYKIKFFSTHPDLRLDVCEGYAADIERHVSNLRDESLDPVVLAIGDEYVLGGAMEAWGNLSRSFKAILVADSHIDVPYDEEDDF